MDERSRAPEDQGGGWVIIRRMCSSRSPKLQIFLVVAALAAACGGGGNQTAPAAKPVSNPVDPATAGNVTGKVTLQGAPPPAETLKTKSDPNCTQPVMTEDFLVGDGGAFGNVFVYVKDGLGNRVFPVPTTSVTLGQNNCTYRPHVLGVQVGQNVDIVNNDPTLHNIHAIPKANQEFNMAQSIQGMRHQHVFSTKEIMVPFKCDVHKWMSAFVGVVDHPYFAVTGPDGAFALKGLPPGTYTVEAIHEKLGAQTQTVTIGEKESKDIAFTFKI